MLSISDSSNPSSVSPTRIASTEVISITTGTGTRASVDPCGRPTVFSIEKLFDVLSAQFEKTGAIRIELPHISRGDRERPEMYSSSRASEETGHLHITGDVHYAALLCSLSKTVIALHDCVVPQRGTGLKRFVM
jgi:hypothetical protein